MQRTCSLTTTGQVHALLQSSWSVENAWTEDVETVACTHAAWHTTHAADLSGASCS